MIYNKSNIKFCGMYRFVKYHIFVENFVKIIRFIMLFIFFFFVPPLDFSLKECDYTRKDRQNLVNDCH